MLDDPAAERALGQAMVEHHPDLVVVLERSDDTVRIVACNDGVVANLRSTREEVVGRDLRQVTSPEMAAAALSRMDQLDQHGGPVSYEVTREVPAGTRTYASTLVPVVTAERRLVVTITKDITDQRSAETALADTSRLARIGHWSWDVVHDEVSWSDEMYRIYGLEPSVERADLDAVVARTHPDDREGQRDRLRRLLEEGESYRADVRIERPDGDVRTVEIRGRPVRDADGTLIRVAGTVQDLTEQRQMESAARAAEAATERQAQALDLNDNVLQGLAVARLALQLGDTERALAAVDSTLEAARSIISELLSDRVAAGGLEPGDLVRGQPAVLDARGRSKPPERDA